MKDYQIYARLQEAATALENMIGHARFVASNFDVHYMFTDEALEVLGRLHQALKQTPKSGS